MNNHHKGVLLKAEIESNDSNPWNLFVSTSVGIVTGTNYYSLKMIIRAPPLMCGTVQHIKEEFF